MDRKNKQNSRQPKIHAKVILPCSAAFRMRSSSAPARWARLLCVTCGVGFVQADACPGDFSRLSLSQCDLVGPKVTGLNADACMDYCVNTDGCVAVQYGFFTDHCWQCLNFDASSVDQAYVTEVFYCDYETTTPPTTLFQDTCNSPTGCGSASCDATIFSYVGDTPADVLWCSVLESDFGCDCSGCTCAWDCHYTEVVGQKCSSNKDVKDDTAKLSAEDCAAWCQSTDGCIGSAYNTADLKCHQCESTAVATAVDWVLAWMPVADNCASLTTTPAKVTTTTAKPVTTTNSIDCPGSWGEWGACSATCDGGTQTRSWTATTTCDTEPVPMTKQCATEQCVCSGYWSEEQCTNCSSTTDMGYQHRTFVEATILEGGSIACPADGVYNLVQECQCSDCLGTWTDWSACSMSCGVGSQFRTFTVLVEASYGGTPCWHATGFVDEGDCAYALVCPGQTTTHEVTSRPSTTTTRAKAYTCPTTCFEGQNCDERIGALNGIMHIDCSVLESYFDCDCSGCACSAEVEAPTGLGTTTDSGAVDSNSPGGSTSGDGDGGMGTAGWVVVVLIILLALGGGVFLLVRHTVGKRRTMSFFGLGRRKSSKSVEKNFTMSFINRATTEADSITHMVHKLSTTQWWIDFDSVQVESRLGAGTSGSVFRGNYEGAHVALKELHSRSNRQNGSNNDFRHERLFLREAKIWSRLHHPHVAHFYGFTASEGGDGGGGGGGGLHGALVSE